MKSFITSCIVVLLATAAAAQTTYDRHVIFDNSLPDGGYDACNSYLVAPSTLELNDNKFPVETKHFVSPPNALRLKWRSAPGGDWRMTLEIPRRYARPFRFEGDMISFWCFSETEITAANTPRLFLQDTAKEGTPSIPLVSGKERIPAGQWVQLKYPFTGFKSPNYNGTDDNKFKSRDFLSVAFMQGLDDNAEHTLYLDDFQIRDGTTDDVTPPPVPTDVAVRGYERHFDVSWKASSAPDLLSYRIYRSLDGKKFQPVGTQQGSRTRFSDFVGEPSKQAHYRVTALDVTGNESAPSSAAHASTRALNDTELLDMVQEACFRYYWDAGHPHAGLAPEVLPGDENLLALGGNGFGVMALVVATERQFVTRDQAAERLLKILRFLASADRFHGVWPHFINGDTGKAIPYFGKYDNGGDLVETAFMMQGLLTARQYFNRETSAENEIRETITRLWREVEWDWYRKTPDSNVLYWHWSPDHGFYINHPLVGWNEAMIIYLLAIASPTHAVPASMYHTGWAGTSEQAVTYRQGWSRTTQGDHYLNGGSYYGIKLEVGEGNGAE